MSDEHIGFAGLWAKLAAGSTLEELGPQMEARLARDPSHHGTALDLATLLILTQNAQYRALALLKQREAIAARQVYRVARSGGPASVRLLVAMSPGDLTANTPVDCLLHGSDVAIDIVYVSAERPMPRELPEHDAVFVAVGQSEANQPLLAQLETFAATSPKPVLNMPDAIRRMTRTGVFASLRDTPGVVMPATAQVARLDLLTVAWGREPISDHVAGGRFPLIVRPVDSQGGRHLERTKTPEALAEYLKRIDGATFHVANFVDYRDEDGYYRKWRIAFVAGEPFVCHVGVSADWMIHYVNAGMYDSAAKRALEAELMDSFEQGFRIRHEAALAAICERIGLDYFGIDCAETRDGKLLVFEADAASLVHGFDDPALFPYKTRHMQRLFSAFRALLLERAKHAAEKVGAAAIA